MAIMNHLENSYLSVCKAINYLAPWCENICIPIKYSFSYDLIVESKGVISRIKVLRTDCKAPSGSYVVNLRKSGREGTKKEPFNPKMCEFVFVESPSGDYFIPSFEISQKRAITLSMFGKYLIPTV